MRLRVSLYGEFRRYRAERVFHLELPPGATAGALLAELGIPADPYAWMTVNGERAAPGRRLEDGDDVTVFAPAGGG